MKFNGWKEIARPDGIECDQFDNDMATYVLAVDRGQIVGGSRLVPSTEPHLLSDVFPRLAEVKGVPSAPDIFEWTRMFVVKERREGRNMGRTAGAIICGVLEHCLAQGVAALTAIVEMFWLPRFHDMGWTVKPLGLPELISGEWSVAVLMPIDERVLQSTRALYGIVGSVLADAGDEKGLPKRARSPAGVTFGSAQTLSQQAARRNCGSPGLESPRTL